MTIPAHQAWVKFALSGVDDGVADGRQSVQIGAAADGFIAASAQVSVTDISTPILSLNVGGATLPEPGTLLVAVSRNTEDTSAELLVDLSSDDTGEAEVPSTVTIPVGQSSATFEMSGVDDGVADGNQSVRVSATASGFTEASALVTVTDASTPALSLGVGTATFSESGTLSVVVSRNTENNSAALVVALSSDDAGEAALPAAVTILAGQVSATFELSGVDDGVADGNQSVRISATADGFTATSALVTVTDASTPALSLEVGGATLAESGTLAVLVRRNTEDNSAALVVTLSGDDAGEVALPSTVTIPANQASATFELGGVNDGVADGSQSVTIGAAASGFTGASASVTVTDISTPTLSLNVGGATLPESGTLLVAVSRNTEDNGAALIVNLSISDTGEASAPATVTIPPNQASVTFELGGVNDGVADGSQSVKVDAAASGFAATSASVTVTDASTPTLSLSTGGAILSESGTLSVAVSRNTEDNSVALVVALASDDTGEAVVPSTVTIPAGEASATFEISGVDDDVADGSQSVRIDAAADGFIAASAQVSVADASTPTLSLDVGEAILSEDGVLSVVLSRNTEDNSAALVAIVSSEDTGEAEVLAAVTIPADQVWARFELSGVDDGVADGTQSVTITATAIGFTAASAQVLVSDVSVPTLSLDVAGAILSESGTLAAVVHRNTEDNSAALVVIPSSDDVGEAALPSTVTIPAGQASATFEISGVDDGVADGPQSVTIDATAVGFTAASALVTVTDASTPALSLDAGTATLSESGTLSIAVSRNTEDHSAALVVTLGSNDAGEVALPAAVTILSGQASATFEISGVDDGVADGSQSVRIDAAADGFIAASAQLLVTDTLMPTLSLEVGEAVLSESGVLSVLLSRNTEDNGAALVVTVSSEDAGR